MPTVANYSVSVRSPREREQAIAADIAATEERARFHYFRSSEQRLPVIRVPVDLPIYRLVNARTQDEQLSLMAAGAYPAGFFDPGRQEDEEVQGIQHKILFDFSQMGKGENIVPIYDELAQKRVQTDPILITAQGVVVNGNRRLAAMRELSSGDDAIEDFGHINCMVLPASANEDDLLEIEFKLQMARETKLPYTWTNEARICKHLRDNNVSIKRIAEMRDEEPKQVENLILMYELAERYLREWIDQPGNFHALEKTRQAFRQMVTRRNAKRPREQKEVADAFGFFIIENREELEDRAYQFINSIEGDPPEFFKEFASNVGFDLAAPVAASDVDEEPLFIDLTGDEPLTGTNPMPLKGYLKDIRKDADLTVLAIEAIQSVSEVMAQKKKDPGGTALKLSKDALRKLKNIDMELASAKTFDAVVDNLRQIEERAKELLAQAGH